MLKLLTPQEFDERYAAWLLDGAGNDRVFAAAIVAEIRNLIPRYVQSKSPTLIPASNYTRPEDLIPEIYRPASTRRTDRIYADDPRAAELLEKIIR